MAEGAGQLLAIAEELYGLDLPAFTPARDAHAKDHRRTELGTRLKGLRKPSTAAWVVNLLVRREAEQVEQVLAVGAALREAQASMSGEELRALTRQRRQLTSAVTTRARALAREHGVTVSESVADQVEATLTAAMVDEGCAEAVRSGLLTTSIETTGVEEVDATAVVALPEALGFRARAREASEPERPRLEVVPDPEADAKARRAAQEELDAAEAELGEAADALETAREEVNRLEARGLQLQAEAEELRARIAALEEEHDAVDEELAEAEDARAEAEDEVAELTRARDAARSALSRLKG